MKFRFSQVFRTLWVLTFCVALCAPVLAQQADANPPRPTSYPERTTLWEKAILRFEESDRQKGIPAPGGIVFVGSSSIVGWKTLAEDFPGLPVLNRGFGGSEIQDSVFYAGRVVLPYKPAVVVLYAGDNDVAAGRTQEQIVGSYQAFVEKIHAVSPDTKILFLAIKPSPSRWKHQERIVAANRAIAEWSATRKNLGYIDVHTPMLGEEGMPRPEYYLADRLHMTPEGYKLWTRIVAPHLKEAYTTGTKPTETANPK
ncbi:MAG: SGNH/GDSL hydrolase family protein [Armatimonadaceae bacterium]